MWEFIQERITISTLIYAASSSIIPLIIYQVMSSVQKAGDPAWKKKN